MDLVKKRRSIRRYKPDLILDQDLETVLEAARLAPSCGNRQCWRYVIVTDPGIKKKLAEAGKWNTWLNEAPVVIVACASPGESHRKHGMDYFAVDTAISFEHLILAATNLGLGTCWIGDFDEDMVKEALGVPDEMRVVTYTALGYPDEKKGQVFDRKPLRDICFYERYGQVKSQGLQGGFTSTIGKQYIKGRKFGESLRRKGRKLTDKFRNLLAS